MSEIDQAISGVSSLTSTPPVDIVNVEKSEEPAVPTESVQDELEEPPLKKQKVEGEPNQDREQEVQEQPQEEPQEQTQQDKESSEQPSNEGSHTQSQEPLESTTVLRNGIHIPKDSALLSKDIDYNPWDSLAELSPQLLVKANLASLPLTMQANDSLPIRIQFIINSIPLLDNISTQILRFIGVGSYEETLAIITNEEPTPEGLVFKDLVELFENIKKIFSDYETPFLNFKKLIRLNLNDELYNDDSIWKDLINFKDSVELTLKKTNLSTFLLATLGSIEVGFFFLNESFLDVFCPVYEDVKGVQGKILKAQAALFLELKTQAYISALEAGNRSKLEILQDIFPLDLNEILINRKSSDQLTPVELDFLNRCNSRRETLLNLSEEEIENLSENYEWLIFLKDLFNYVSKNIGFLIYGKKGRGSIINLNIESNYRNLSKEQLQEKLNQQRQKELDAQNRELEQASTANNTSKKSKDSANKQDSTSSTAQSSGPPRIRNILRRPWSKEEEDALVEAMKEFGTHWAKILENYGAGGSKSEALKNRNQVQLKDKARNWKMAYLKNGSPVPDYLLKATGELERDDNARRKRLKKVEKVNTSS